MLCFFYSHYGYHKCFINEVQTINACKPRKESELIDWRTNPHTYNTAKKLLKNVNWREAGHTALDVAGYIPFVGTATDLANAAWYAAEGDYASAALSAVSAVPLVGDAIGTVGKAGKAAVKLTRARKLVTNTAKLVPGATTALSASNKILQGSRKVIGNNINRIAQFSRNRLINRLSPAQKQLLKQGIKHLPRLGMALWGAYGSVTTMQNARTHFANGDYVNAALSATSALFGARNTAKLIPRNKPGVQDIASNQVPSHSSVSTLKNTADNKLATSRTTGSFGSIPNSSKRTFNAGTNNRASSINTGNNRLQSQGAKSSDSHNLQSVDSANLPKYQPEVPKPKASSAPTLDSSNKSNIHDPTKLDVDSTKNSVPEPEIFKPKSTQAPASNSFDRKSTPEPNLKDTNNTLASNNSAALNPQIQETLRQALPRDLQGRVPIEVSSDLTGNTVRVHYEVDKNGLVTNIHMRVGSQATAVDIQLHAQTVRLMQRYSGFSGRIQILQDRIAGWIKRNGVPSVGSRAWEAKLEVEKLPRIIQERLNRLSKGGLDESAEAALRADIESLEFQLAKYKQTLNEMDANPGKGFVAAQGPTPQEIQQAIQQYKHVGDEYLGSLSPVLRERQSPTAGKRQLPADRNPYHEWYYGNLRMKGMDYDELVQNFVKNNRYGMNEAEAQAVFGYSTVLFYPELNKLLREEVKPETTESLTALINRGLNKLPPAQKSKEGHLYRGVNIMEEDALQKFLNVHQKDRIVTYKEFISSASYPVQPFWDQSNIRIVMTPKLNGSKGRDITELGFGTHFIEILTKGKKKNDTDEALFMTDSEFKVTDVIPEGSEIRNITNKETGVVEAKEVGIYNILLEEI